VLHTRGRTSFGGVILSRITVVGIGYVGLTTAACLADLGNSVCGVDVDPTIIDALHRGEVPFFEPGLQEMVVRNLAAGRLRFTSFYAEAVPEAEFVFIAVGTPMAETGEADLTYVRAAAAMIAEHQVGPLLIVNKSTVPIGTADIVSDIVRRTTAGRLGIRVVSNPEFLREGSAIRDFMEPDRIVLGSADPDAAALVAELYEPLSAPILITNAYTAEMIKYASNAFLATKISFINEVARVCERVGADVKVVAEGMGMDPRVGARFLEAGLGYGGSCLPKDVTALVHTSKAIGAHPQLLSAVMEINNSQPQLLVDKLEAIIGSLSGTTVTVLGLSFKPDTDDMRAAPSLTLIAELQRRGASVRAYDPAAMASAKELLSTVAMADDPYGAAEGADALVIATEWNEFRQLDLGRIKEVMKQPVIVDGRNLYQPDELRRLGFEYRGVGR
jgi:UDPglucose 6-dehydrogenase